jgi:hypothetical protein
MTAPQPEQETNRIPHVGHLSASEARELVARMREVYGPAIFQSASDKDITEVALSAIQEALYLPEALPRFEEPSFQQVVAPGLHGTEDGSQAKKSLLARLANAGLGRRDHEAEPPIAARSPGPAMPPPAARRPPSPPTPAFFEQEERQENELARMRDLVLHSITARLGSPDDHLAYIRNELRSVKNVGP